MIRARHAARGATVNTREPRVNPSYQCMPVPLSLTPLDPGLRRDDGKGINQGFSWSAILWLLLLLPVWSAQARTELPAPPHARVMTVTTGTKAMGMQLRIRRFETRQSVDEVLAFYHKRWKDHVAESRMPPWQMIGRLIDGEYHNVQVQARAGGGSWGYLSISDLPKRARQHSYTLSGMGKGFPRMGGSRVLDDQSSHDPGKLSRTLMLNNNFSVRSNTNFYKRHYQGLGWRLLLDEASAAHDQGHVLTLARRGEQVTITLNRVDGKTNVVANHEQTKVLGW